MEIIINNSFSVYNISYNDKLSGLIYLLLQDRIEESLDLYKIVKLDENENGNGKESLIIDYLRVYTALYRSEDEMSHWH